jgi:hypothetical protein
MLRLMLTEPSGALSVIMASLRFDICYPQLRLLHLANA